MKVQQQCHTTHGVLDSGLTNPVSGSPSALDFANQQQRTTNITHYLLTSIKLFRGPTVFDALAALKKTKAASPKFFCSATLSIDITYSVTDAWSIRTPGPIVLETDNFLRNIPFVEAGFALLIASTNAAKLADSCSTLKDARPIVQ